MRVPSPTRVPVLGILAGTLGLAAALLVPSTASAADPHAPGDFTGYGFDACVAPSQKVMDAWNLRSPFTAIGIYISGSSRYCGDKYQPNLSKSWVATNASNGWRFIPIHVGRQSPCFKNNPSSRVQKKKMSSTISTARGQGEDDADETIAALKKYGFGSGSVSYLDLEWYSRTTSCDNAVLEFSDAWTETLHDAGYKSGVYSSGSAAIAAIDAADKAGRKGFTRPDHLWIAWTNKKADTDGGPYLRDTVWDDHQRIHQYENGINVTYGGYTVNLDRDFLDVGKGSVATTDPKPCDVAMSFSSYPRLDPGDTGSRVSALQCLLKQSGQSVSVNGTFGSSTSKAIDAFRKSLGWGPTGHTTNPTWTALLSAGSKPRVLKRGSVGEAVWRLQRALLPAGLSVTVNGVYDTKTVSAVKKYRSANGLTAYETTDSSVWALIQRGKPGA